MWWLLLLAGCIDSVQQTAGTGATYTTRCSSEMEARGVEYFARCTPETCATGYTSEAVSNVVVAVVPGAQVVGYAERVCVQDLSNAAKMFQPPEAGEPGVTVTPAGEAAPAPK